mmetsp:Transcript_100760/g.159400  ORF Transcript_100760/g.159400 Transcript_100760/m.159400 type:complete len:206 (-) Transcript_100760:652-1269(-)
MAKLLASCPRVGTARHTAETNSAQHGYTESRTLDATLSTGSEHARIRLNASAVGRTKSKYPALVSFTKQVSKLTSARISPICPVFSLTNPSPIGTTNSSLSPMSSSPAADTALSRRMPSKIPGNSDGRYGVKPEPKTLHMRSMDSRMQSVCMSSKVGAVASIADIVCCAAGANFSLPTEKPRTEMHSKALPLIFAVAAWESLWDT